MGEKGRTNWREDSPRGLCTEAIDFRTAARDALDAHIKRASLTSPLPSDSSCVLLQLNPSSLVVYYFFLHAIELALKSYLRQVEAVTLKELRGWEFGHDISRLIDVALENGICDQCSLEESHIGALRCLSPLYKDKRFEYFRLGLISLPPIELIANAADGLIDGIKGMKLRLAKDPAKE